MFVAEYINKLNELMVRCDIQETIHQTISQFCTGLKLEIRKELFPHVLNSLEHTYNMAL